MINWKKIPRYRKAILKNISGLCTPTTSATPASIRNPPYLRLYTNVLNVYPLAKNRRIIPIYKGLTICLSRSNDSSSSSFFFFSFIYFYFYKTRVTTYLTYRNPIREFRKFGLYLVRNEPWIIKSVVSSWIVCLYNIISLRKNIKAKESTFTFKLCHKSLESIQCC